MYLIDGYHQSCFTVNVGFVTTDFLPYENFYDFRAVMRASHMESRIIFAAFHVDIKTSVASANKNNDSFQDLDPAKFGGVEKKGSYLVFRESVIRILCLIDAKNMVPIHVCMHSKVSKMGHDTVLDVTFLQFTEDS